MADRHRSAVWLLWLLSGCGPDPEPDRTLLLRAHSIADCALGADATLELTALGDFDASAVTSESLSVVAEGRELVFPLETLGVEAFASAGLTSWNGVGTLDGSGDIDVALWDASRDCALFEASDGSGAYPGRGGGQAIGWSSQADVLLVTGGDSDVTNETLGALALDLRTAAVTQVERLSNERRAFATVAASGERLLVAGGLDPIASEQNPDRRALGTAHFFDPATNEFAESVELADPRSRHRAVTLPSGEVLLIGGADETDRPRGTLEAIAADGSSRLAGLATLAEPRVDPAVVTLSDGRILVGAGETEVDGVRAAAPNLEWLSSDGAELLAVAEFPARRDLALVAMPRGGALAVGGCDAARSRAPEVVCESVRFDCACSDPCPVGCVSREVRWITAQGVINLVAPLDFDPGPKPRLIAGSDGRPWLVGSSEVRRFDPWTARFVVPEDRPLEVPDGDQPPPIATDAGLFVWLDMSGGTASLRGFRHGSRSELARDIAPLLLSDATNVAPTIPPSATGVSYDPARGLALRDPLGGAVIADTTYAGLGLNIELSEGEPPVVILGETPVGGSECPWPEPSAATLPETLIVNRTEDRAVLSRGGQTIRCDVPRGRLTVALTTRAGSASLIRSLAVRRTPIVDTP